MLPVSQLQLWEDQFAVKLPFRKLSKLLISLPCNVRWNRLKGNGWLPSSCSVSDLMLYDNDDMWKQVHEASLTSIFTAKPLQCVSAFTQQAEKALGTLSDAQRLQHIWRDIGVVLHRGLGLSTAGNTSHAERCCISI